MSSRTDPSLVSRWWRDIDRTLLIVLGVMVTMGVLVMLGTYDPLSSRYNAAVAQNIFLKQGFMLAISLGLALGVSFLSPHQILRLSLAVMMLSLIGCILTVTIGTPINGAYRWIRLGGIALQPSEFLKPSFAVVTARLLTSWRLSGETFDSFVATGLMLILVAVLMLQPDVGQSLLLITIWFTQFFLSGLPIFFVVISVTAVFAALVGVYLTIPYVQSRIDRFISPDGADTYQITQSRRAIEQGGLLGNGPGGGEIKFSLPDVHSDFIYALAVEEWGVVIGVTIPLLFLVVAWRVVRRMSVAYSLFVIIANLGLMVLLIVQAWINMASTLAIIPTKGMTLPLFSIGGSSTLATALTIGFLMAFTRQSANLRE